MASRMVTYLMTSCVYFSYSVLIAYCHATLRIDKIAWKYRKTANIIEKLQFIILLTEIVHCFTQRKQDKGYITKQHVDILTRCSKSYNLYHFCCFRCVKQCTIAVNSVIN